MFEIEKDMRVAHNIAQMFAPYDTGNVRFNAIKSFRTSDGFAIRYSLSDAFYIYFLEEGTKNKGGQKHVGFIANRTVPAIANFIYTKYEKADKKKTDKIANKARYASIDPDIDSESRLTRHNMSLNTDLDKLSTKQGKEWAHDPAYEQFDENWKRGDFFD
jgi:hypothetical protein